MLNLNNVCQLLHQQSAHTHTYTHTQREREREREREKVRESSLCDTRTLIINEQILYFCELNYHTHRFPSVVVVVIKQVYTHDRWRFTDSTQYHLLHNLTKRHCRNYISDDI